MFRGLNKGLDWWAIVHPVQAVSTPTSGQVFARRAKACANTAPAVPARPRGALCASVCIVEAQMGDLKAQMGDFKAQRHQVMFGVFIWLAYGTTPLILCARAFFMRLLCWRDFLVRT